ncbi:MAG: YbaB/EbfC family nucleoid-associated protein [Candidatus Omnitrophica bacterium]|jgi:DNA-binding protein YbaB|nr:YbaB/EbfC family nucleoid-associated protein [Candidatus Omnitrophota bacterium]MDD3274422.1 YbaB/EbfC family nucleoid-associated protein [Candidatus Omnitrophota bacterium]MDD5077712.1 YbaB/EbfC family nucleoid-associated protein [Candidatus Omnitrophota bacterium]MDD5725061.1 YbaB/EbfC family nucleoid-associated protein [Candidatus Omnitrophota bacterium]
MFDKMKGLFEMQKKMQEVKRALEEAVFEIKSSDGAVEMKMNGAQQVQEVRIKEGLTPQENARLGDSLKDTFNRAVKRSQEIAAGKMREVTGINLPGLT